MPPTEKPPRGSRVVDEKFSRVSYISILGENKPHRALTGDAIEVGDVGGRGSTLGRGKDGTLHVL